MCHGSVTDVSRERHGAIWDALQVYPGFSFHLLTIPGLSCDADALFLICVFSHSLGISPALPAVEGASRNFAKRS